MVLVSCMEEPESPQIELADTSEIAQVKTWFEENKTNLRLPERGSNFRTESQELILPFFEKEPDWDQFHHYYFPDGREVFEASLENATKYFPSEMAEIFSGQNPSEIMIQNIMFVRHASLDQFNVVLARYYPGDDDSKSNFDEISYNGIPALWKGKLEMFTYDERFFVGFEFEEGEMMSSYTRQIDEDGKRKNTANLDVRCVTNRYPVGYQVCADGFCHTTITHWVEEYSCFGADGGATYVYTSEGGSGERDPATDGGGSNNTDPTPPELPAPNFKITNTISFREYPCLSSSVNNAIDKNFSNEIQDLILDVFGESEDFNIEIEAFDFNDDTLDGTTFLSGGDPKHGYATFTISINTFLENVSQEYITATIFHEFLHAYIDYLDLPNIRPSDQADHEEMANKYLEKLSLILINQYGIKESHAEALSWGGLGETKVFNDLYDSEKSYIGQINDAYKNGNKGTKCD